MFLIRILTMKSLILAGLTAVSVSAFAEDISTSGWRLWPDRAATWEDETLYLPSEVKLKEMPVNAPTGGWRVLNDEKGISITLPTTVEEHFWGRSGTRPYARNEA